MKRLVVAAFLGATLVLAAAAFADTPDGRPVDADPGPVVAQSEAMSEPESGFDGSDVDDPTAAGVTNETPVTEVESLDDGRPPGAVPGPITSSEPAAAEPVSADGDDHDDPSAPPVAPTKSPPVEALDQGR